MERDLWQAVLRQAYGDARGTSVPGEDSASASEARREVSGWVWSDDFSAVCVLAGVAVVNARRSILRALRRGGPVNGPERRAA